MILDKTFPPDPRVENEALELIKNGHELFLFCLGYSGVFEQENYKDIHIRRYPSNQLEYKLSALAYTLPFYSSKMSTKVAHFLDENSVEIIHVHDMVVAEAVMAANERFKLPLILDLHENRPEIMKTYPHLQKLPGKLLISTKTWKHKEEKLVQKADKVIVVTKEAKAELIKRTKSSVEKFVVVSNTVKESFFKDYKTEYSILEKYKNKFVLLYLGDTGLRRGLLAAIEAVGLLAQEPQMKEQLKLVIVGQNSTDAVLKQKVEELGLDSMVDFEGWKDVGLFPSYLLAAHIGLSPLHKNAHHDTTYANKLFQYMSFSLPLLVSDVIAQKNLIDEVGCGLVHRDRDVDQMAAQILSLYKDPALAHQLGRKGKTYIEEKFSWEKVSGNLKKLYLDFEK